MNRRKIFKPILACLFAFMALMGATPAFASTMPNVSGISGVSGDFERDPSVYMGSTLVAAQRYMVQIDGISYEAYCADPTLRGPENAGAVYELSGEANPHLLNALKNGFPINSEWSGQGSNDERMYWIYVTRVAVAMARHPSLAFSGDDLVTDHARSLANGSYTANHADYPPIMVNGVKDASDTGRIIDSAAARSVAFAVTYNRKTSLTHNPFRFEWAAGTPAGAKLVVGGQVIATAPSNSSTIYSDNITSFQIEMPNTAAFEGKTAAVNLVGVHNQFADRIWLMQNPNSPDTWQDIVFYIPPVAASAAFSFATDDTPPPPFTPDPEPTSVIIQKIDALTRENIPGALMRLRGISSHQVVTEDGQIWEIDNTGINLSQVLTAGATVGGGDVVSTVTDGVWALEGLPYGAYIVEEERAPNNYSLLPQHTAYGFWLLPPNVSIKVNQEESQAVVDIQEAIDSMLEAAIAAAIAAGQPYPNIPALLQEIRQILADTLSNVTLDVVFDVEEGTAVNSHLITFENYPFGKIEVTKYDEVTGNALAGAHFRIQGYFPEGNTNGMPIDRVDVTGNDGRIVFDNLPAGQYTISEVQAPPGYQLDGDAFRSISITWGQTASTTFYNKPKTFVEVIKVDGDDSSKLLNGAFFRLSDPTSGEIWEGVTSGGRVRLGEGSGSFGNQLVEGKLYILTEVQAPNGYVLDASPIEVIVSADNQLNSITVRNFHKPTLTIRKYDELTNEPLAGASFRIWRTEGAIWSETRITDADGEIVLTDLDPGIYSVQEIDEPYGYFRDPERREILFEGGDDKELQFFNRPRPVLTILKRDANTGEPLADTVFKVQKTDGVTIGEFTTDADGRIVLSPDTGYLLEEAAYTVTEITPPDGYLLGDNPARTAVLKWHEPTELIFENLPKPTLTVIKRDELTGEPLAGASFRLWKTEGETWSETQITGADGTYTWHGLDAGIYSIQEIDEPYGYFRDPARKEILLEGGDNKQLEFFNRPRPVLTILKRDQVTGEPLSGVLFRVQQLEGLTIGEFTTDENGMIELSPRTGYLLEERIYRITEVTPPIEYLLGEVSVREVMLKWYEPTELTFENLMKPTLIFIKRDGMSGRGIPGATFRVQYESPTGGVTAIGDYVTKCGLIVLPYVTPGWYVLTETKAAPGYALPTNPVTRMYLAPGQNSYTYAQTQSDLYADPRTNPNSGNRGNCGDWCGYLCSVLCGGNCGNPGDGTMSGGNGGLFGNINITNGNGDPLGGGNTNPNNPGTNPSIPALSAGTVTRNSDMTATITFTSSAEGRYYYSVVNAGANEPAVGTGGLGTVCNAGANTITVYMTAGAKDVYIKVKDANGNVSDALKISVPAYSPSAQSSDPPATQGPPPNFDNIVITGGTVVYLNPDFAGIVITFGNQ